jgi:hypothetical protein
MTSKLTVVEGVGGRGRHVRLLEHFEQWATVIIWDEYQGKLTDHGPSPVELSTRRRRKTSKPGPDGAGPALQRAFEAVGDRRPGELKQVHRDRLADWIKEQGGMPPSDPKTYRKYGY